jgi:F-type H+-transporting ATPase subunit delta
MAIRLSRRKIAAYIADKLVGGTSVPDAVNEVAAYLIDTRRTRELELLVRDIEDALASRGIIVGDVTSMYPLGASLKAEIAKLVGGKSLQLRETIDPAVLGGVRVNIPGKRFDGTIQRKLSALKAKQL